MTGGEFFLYVGGFLLLLSVGGMILERILGPEPESWSPGDRPWWRP
jgi:hypothetical protein